MKWEIVVLMMFLVACGSTAPASTESEQVVSEQVTVSEPSTPMTTSEMMGMSMAMKLGKPIKCTSTQDGQTVTIYMKGSKMRMDTSPVDAHGIYTEDTMYSWSGKQGMMMKMEDIKKMASQAQPIKTQEEVVANAEQTNAQCSPASVDESMFTPPGDVQFQDFGALMSQMPQIPQMPQ